MAAIAQFKNPKYILTILFGIFMIYAGIMHFVKPEVYFPFIPDFLPENIINILSGILEIILGIGVFIPRYRTLAALGILLTMLAFLPLHIIDVFKEHPAIGSHRIALIRLPLQFVLILWAWFIYKKNKKTTINQ